MAFSKEFNEEIDKIRLKLILSGTHGFLGFLLNRLPILDLNEYVEQNPELKKQDNFHGTACTNGNAIYVNPDWFMSLEPKLREIVIMHEVMHVARLHPLRGINKEHKDHWNKAMDAFVNRDLRDSGFDFGSHKDNFYFNEQHEDLTEEELYRVLIEDIKDDGKNPPPSPNDGNGSGDNNGEGQGNSIPDNPQEAIANDVLPADPKDKQQQIQKISESIQQAKQRGTGIPGDLEQAINDFLYPVLPWYEILNKFLDSYKKGHVRTWRRPNRRYPDTYRPSPDREREEIKLITAYIDCSGSVSDEELKEYLSELRHIKKQFNPKKMNICCFDTEINKVVSFKQKEDIKEFELVGRGGTDYEPVMKDIETNKPKIALIFTDMYCPIPDKPKCNTQILWVATEQNSLEELPYGIPEYGKVFFYNKYKKD